MYAKRWFVWSWEFIDAEGRRCAYVGCDNHEAGGPHPAAVLWGERLTVRSELHDWLASLAAPPDRLDFPAEQPIFRLDGLGIAFGLREGYRRNGVKLITTRPHGSKRGGGTSKPVLDPNGDYHESVRQAAEAHGVSEATIVRYCKDPGNLQWDYVYESDRHD
jgi:hypothetical protein